MARPPTEVVINPSQAVVTQLSHTMFLKLSVSLIALFLVTAFAAEDHPSLRWNKKTPEQATYAGAKLGHSRWGDSQSATVKSQEATDVKLQGAGGGGASSSSDSGDKKGCFAGTETLLLESGSSISMEDVKLGDRVQVASSDNTFSFATVIHIPHSKNRDQAQFVEIQTFESSLKVTPYHLIMTSNCEDVDKNMQLKAAQDVTITDCLVSSSDRKNREITAVSKTSGEGVYTVVTDHSDGFVVVNGYVASSFSYSHVIVNSYYHLHRALYSYFGFNLKTNSRMLESIAVGVISH